MSEEVNDPAPEDLFLIVLVALLGYERENKKLFSVDKNILKAIYQNGIDKNEMPRLILTHADDRLEIQIEMEKVIDEPTNGE